MEELFAGLGEGTLGGLVLPAAVMGVGVGIGVGLAQGALALLGEQAGTLAAGAMQLGMAAGNQVQQWTVGAREQWGDIVAEARAERSGVNGTTARG